MRRCVVKVACHRWFPPKIRHFPTSVIIECMEKSDDIIHFKGKWFYNKKVNTFYKGDKKYKKK